MSSWLFVLVRIAVNPFSNVFQKALTRRAAHPLFIILFTHGLLSVACLPVLLQGFSPPAEGFWLDISTCTVLAVVGNALLVQAVKLSDLSVLGPINAYKAVISLIPGALLLGEVPGLMGLAGIALIVIGSYFLVDTDATEPHANAFLRFFKEQGIRYRFAALVLTATEAVFLKRALLASSPLTTLGFWSVLGFGVSLAGVAIVFRGDQIVKEAGLARTHVTIYLMLAATTGLMQLSTLVVLAGLQVGYTLALFQTSTIVSVVLGHTLFQEPHFLERLTGSLIMVAGAVLIVLGR